MAIYHICDLCGKDIKNRNTYYIKVGPITHIKDSFTEVLENSLNKRPDYISKELCEDCAKVWSDNFKKIEEFRDRPDWEAKIYSPKYEDVNSNLHYRDNFYKMEVDYI